jgi:hypothetical protein
MSKIHSLTDHDSTIKVAESLRDVLTFDEQAAVCAALVSTARLLKKIARDREDLECISSATRKLFGVDLTKIR